MALEGKLGELRNVRAELNVGDVYIGFISNVMPYGIFVQIGRNSALCHNSGIPSEIITNDLVKGRRVKVLVREIRSDQKYSLTLLELLPTETTSRSTDSKAADFSSGALIANNLEYSQNIGATLKQGVAEINKVGLQYKNNTAPTRTGYVAEPDQTATFNLDAAFQRSKAKASRIGSVELKSPDIVLHDETGAIVQNISSKIYKSAEKTAKAHRGYGDQVRLSPQDQLDEIKNYSSRRSAIELAKDKPNRKVVLSEYDEVNRLATDRLEQGAVKSGNCQPSCRLSTCGHAAILSSKFPFIFPSFSAMC